MGEGRVDSSLVESPVHFSGRRKGLWRQQDSGRAFVQPERPRIRTQDPRVLAGEALLKWGALGRLRNDS